MRRTITTLIAVAAVMGATAAGYAALGGAGKGTLRARIEPSPVRVTGNTRNLFPGVTRSLPIQVRNRTRGPVRLQWVRAIVGQPRGACNGGYLHVEQIWPQRRIPGRGLIDLVMPITLADEAPDACQGVRFPLRYQTRVNVLGPGR
jgi:hypothetical protein